MKHKIEWFNKTVMKQIFFRFNGYKTSVTYIHGTRLSNMMTDFEYK